MRENHKLLTPGAVMEIVFQYGQLQRTFARSMRKPHSRGLSRRLANKFGVRPRTIRDVWNGKTWRVFTSAMYSDTHTSDGCDLRWLLSDQ